MPALGFRLVTKEYLDGSIELSSVREGTPAPVHSAPAADRDLGSVGGAGLLPQAESGGPDDEYQQWLLECARLKNEEDRAREEYLEAERVVKEMLVWRDERKLAWQAARILKRPERPKTRRK